MLESPGCDRITDARTVRTRDVSRGILLGPVLHSCREILNVHTPNAAVFLQLVVRQPDKHAEACRRDTAVDIDEVGLVLLEKEPRTRFMLHDLHGEA
nr:putative integron gene cassette protein [uncultured bacterium]CAS03042.1 putative integron gene cassette protein [uncultured bacterium]